MWWGEILLVRLMMTRQKEADLFSRVVKDYISELNSLPKEEARRISVENLIRTGVLDENGKPKETIVTENFFGW